MPIQTEHTKLSIDFTYEWVAPDGTTYSYQMRFVHTDLGPIIQIVNDGETIDLPAEMFSETSEFLSSQGVLKTTHPVLPRKALSGTLSLPNFPKKQTPVQPPRKFLKTGTVPMVQPIPVEPLQNLDGLNDMVKVKDETDIPSDSQEEQVENTEEIAALKKERQAALAKSKTDSKRLKPQHRVEE